MRNKPMLWSVIMLAGVMCVPFNESKAQTINESKTRESEARASWDYPVKPGTPQWKEFTTHRQMVEACRIPEGVLSSLTTKELVDICLDYPLFGDITFYENLQKGFRVNVAVSFNGIQELIRREDNVQYLLDRLKGNDLMELSSKVLLPVEVGKSIRKQAFAEVLLSYEPIIAGASVEQQKEIAMIAVRNMAIKEHEHELYGRTYIESSAYLLCASLTKLNGGAALSADLDMFMKEGSSRNIFSVTDELKHSFIKF